MLATCKPLIKGAWTINIMHYTLYPPNIRLGWKCHPQTNLLCIWNN